MPLRFFLMYVKREIDVRTKNCLHGHGRFANRPADTASSLPSDGPWLLVADNTSQKRRMGDKSAQWTRAFSTTKTARTHSQAEDEMNMKITSTLLAVTLNKSLTFIWAGGKSLSVVGGKVVEIK